MFIVLCFKRTICFCLYMTSVIRGAFKAIYFPKQPQIGGRGEIHNYINNDFIFPKNMC